MTIEIFSKKLDNLILDENEIDQQQENAFCNDCLYNWCSKRGKVTYCTMKSKGLFECKSCMIKLLKTTE